MGWAIRRAHSIALADASPSTRSIRAGSTLEFSDPLYKMLPFLHRRWAYAERTASSTTTLRLARSTLAARLTTITACSAPTRRATVTSTITSLPAPPVPDVTRRFSWLTGGQAFAPRWSLGFAMTSMTIADAPDADARISAFVADCKEHHGIRCDSFHFGSGYTSIGPRRYVFNWSREKIARTLPPQWRGSSRRGSNPSRT